MRTMSVFCAAALSAAVAAPAIAQVNLTPIGSYAADTPNKFDESAAEIPAFDPMTNRLFVVNANVGIDVLDISNPFAPTKITSISAPGTNSVAVHNGVLAVAQAAGVDTDPGQVLFYNANDATFAAPIGAAGVGALPDMLTFTPDGMKVLVANEGEPNDDDPAGSVSIIDVSGGFAAPGVSTADFSAFTFANTTTTRTLGNTPSNAVRVDPSATTLAQDLEPEFITVSPDGSKAFVSLQEANTVAVLDLSSDTITSLLPLGTKDHSQPGNGLDPSDRDSGVNIANWPVNGMFMPDSIASYSAGGATFFVTANEGDDRGEDERIKDSSVLLDPTAFPNDATLKQDENLGRLGISTWDGDTDGDGDFDQLFSYGSRSFTIFDENGNVVFDSGDDFEQITANTAGVVFNANNDENDSFESRSDNKGPEPEAIEIARMGGKTLAFIGLERVGGIMVYDITDPNNVQFIEYVNPRDFTIDDANLESDINALAGTVNPADIGRYDLGPEGILFIGAGDSPTGEALLVVANEVSGTTTIYTVPEPASLALLGAGGLLLLRRRA